MLPNYKLLRRLFKNWHKPFNNALSQRATLFENHVVSRIGLEMNKLYTVMIKI